MFMNNDDLKKYDYVVMIDKSGSMSETDCPGGRSRWSWVQEQAMNIARKCAEFDDDGIDVVVFSGSAKEYHGVTPDKVAQIFKENGPSGSTDTAGAIKLVADAYFARRSSGKAKPVIVVCFTDGEPDSKPLVVSTIISIANRLDRDEEFSISFLQVGRNAGARTFLKSLDDDLQKQGAKFDIVDTKDDSEMDGLTVEEILMEAITD